LRTTRIAGVVTAIIAASVASAGTAFAAGNGYGPTPTGPSGVPGGFSSVVITKTLGAGGGSLTAPVAGATLTIRVPSGAFSAPVEVEVTSPDLSAVGSALGNLGYPGFRAVGGLGVKVLNTSGQPVRGTFAKPLTVTLSGSQLGVPGERVLRFTSPGSATVVPASLGSGSVTINLTSDPDLAVVNPPAGTAANVPGATSVHTGLPFTGERDLGLLLIVAGAGGIATVVRRRRGTAGKP
jgi:hypothetical protein